ncbi:MULTISPECIES: homoserine kinase [unclassified Sphingomonas]|uniref:homoserine kinase n=1 Tax=unclassified Sphingomonas TaxID=196159 RepID=UPI001F5921B5|nr:MULTISPECIES: homoserine kinase [unclassified Sphingomonas]
MAVYTHVSAEALGQFLLGFDCGTLVSAKGIAEGVENTNYLVDTTTGRFILTLYEKRVDSGDLPFFLALLDHLAARGNPVPPAIKNRAGDSIHQLEGRPACLIQFLPGVSISHPTAGQARAAGAAMATMHAGLGDFPLTRPNTMGVGSWQPLFERCGHSLEAIAPGLYDTLGFALDAVVRRWPGDSLDRCAIHADLFPDNVLMRGDTVSGLIDFYFACSDIRVFDLAIMDTAWSFDATGAQFDAGISAALLAGYGSRFALSAEETAHFPTLASGACIRFALSRAWDWLNTPADALVTRKDPLAYVRRLSHYAPELAKRTR